ncbi:MAG: UvrD-helicase domain-containing protein [Patescibacteria group bacterium]
MKDLLLDDLNQAQREAVTHGEGPLLIVAGAGTGKTTVITRRIAWLIRDGYAKGDEILGLTFTDKAAGEMEERVDRLLPMGYVDLWISTFHSFGERLLRAHAIDIGLPNEFKLLDTTAQWLLVRKNFQKFDLDYYRPLGNPTKFIHALIKHFSRAKDEGVTPDDYLNHVEELKLNLDQGEATGGAVISHRGTKSLRTKEASNAPSASVETAADRHPPLKVRGGDGGGVIIGGEEESDAGRLEEIARAYKVYEQLLLDEGALDFGDLIMYTLRLLKTRPKILARYQRQFKYILVDEFQDTNWAQYELVKLFAPQFGLGQFFSGRDQTALAPNPSKNRPPLTEEGYGGNLTVVADDDQSIYRFRGAAMSNILQFKKDYPRATSVVLTQNYRSAQAILDLSYQFIQKNNPNRLEAQQGIVKKLISAGNEAAKIREFVAKTGEEETQMVINTIAKIKQSEPALTWNDFAVLVRANSQADAFIQALNRAQIPSQYVASKGLYTKGVILDVVNWLKLLDNYHESASMWRVLNIPCFKIPWDDMVELTSHAHRKSISLYEALRSARAIAAISTDGHRAITVVLGLIERQTQAVRSLSVGKVVLQFLEESGYLGFLTKLPEAEAKEQLSYLDQFYKAISAFEQSLPHASVKQFLEAHEMELESGDAGSLENAFEEGPEAVKVMTVHAAKGLEFHTVFIVQLVDKRFPSVERADPIELPLALVKEIIPEGEVHMEEERRLLYVAMTRAKQNLIFSRAEDYGGARKKKPSQFLYELGLAGEGDEVKGGKKAEEESRTQTHSLRTQTQAPKSVVDASKGARHEMPSKFSFTQLKAFETCPYQYRFAHILHVPVRGRFTFSFGRTMHQTLQQFFALMRAHEGAQADLFGAASTTRRDGPQSVPPLKVLLQLYEKNWIDDWYESNQHKKEYFEKGKKILEEFHAKLSEEPPLPLYLEQGFNLKIKVSNAPLPPLKVRGGIQKDPVSLSEGGVMSNGEVGEEIITIKGVIDRIDEAEGGVEIIDYKTGRAKDMDTADKDQLLIYQIAAREVLGLKPMRLTYYYLDEQKPVSFLGTEEEIAKIKEKIFKTITEIKSSDFHATPSPNVCKFCDFRGICEFRQL